MPRGPSRRSQGQLEAEVLAALAALGGSAGTTELVARLDADPAYTTVNTILLRSAQDEARRSLETDVSITVAVPGRRIRTCSWANRRRA
ncbi:BlaI/MecI/CopY family transcriptional regulator [Actinomadura syzygii]|uniref:BlaI/MecI/CopY family transcriptional regulator n=1 Tax=Actinomadura syzygii TaxID=1427538 RepID=UPI00165291F2|nr:hypothetical protein [Actinomadura syzygii]